MQLFLLTFNQQKKIKKEYFMGQHSVFYGKYEKENGTKKFDLPRFEFEPHF